MYERGGVDHNDTDFAAYGLSSPEPRQDSRNPSHKANTNPLADHPAVANYRGVGVSTPDLVSFIESFASLRASRVKGVGHSQYAIAQGQKFEAFTPADTIRELIEELADASNYIDFLAIKLLNLSYVIDAGLPDCD